MKLIFLFLTLPVCIAQAADNPPERLTLAQAALLQETGRLLQLRILLRSQAARRARLRRGLLGREGSGGRKDNQKCRHSQNGTGDGLRSAAFDRFGSFVHSVGNDDHAPARRFTKFSERRAISQFNISSAC